METADYYYIGQNQQQPGCGLMWYRSAPTSLLQNHVDAGTSTGVTGSGIDFGEFEGFRSSSSHEMEALFMLSANNGSSVKQEDYHVQSLPMRGVGNVSAVEGSFGVGGDVGFENSMGAPEMSNGNGSNLARQSSSLARFFSNQVMDKGFNGTKSRACNGEATSTSRLYDKHISLSSSYSTNPMPQIATHWMTDSRNNASLSGLKRARESGGGGDLLSKLPTQNRGCGDDFTGVKHHLSLAKSCYEMDVVDNYWQFQGSAPCKIRAKRGCATHPRSIAERVRRTRISERMRKLQGLLPNIDRVRQQTNTADMLDMAVEYIKNLQRQLKTLRDTKAKCCCPSKTPEYR
ncbi:bHLH122 protein [Hibiscus syriacus]|uniref:BHLH122 protein n=1 Tax=Hibiscus syriacus TaxID=106335 RepID=A0A6A2XA63_HIBSY|nr:transcription factor bHLH130-like [Hibiscus syriacus]KAE8672152.1 bHLH122 protein [Hibiscus syriacus]